MKAAFYTLGCKVNQYETRIMEQQLCGEGFEIVPHDSYADVYIVNSCTVTAESDRKTRQVLRRLKKQNPGAVTVLAGCFPQSFPEQARSMEEADVITGTKDRTLIGSIIRQALDGGERLDRVEPFDTAETFEPMAVQEFEGRTRAYIKIEDGCRNFCSYCIIPYSRGPVRSKPLADIAGESGRLSAGGYREIVLVGINLSAYGKETGASLADAVAACADSGIERVRLGSLEPNIITPEFISRIKNIPQCCPHFHLSLQSGCAETLRRMNRRYTPGEYRRAVELLRGVLPGCAITTDIIVGFPGETQAEFENSLQFAEEIGFSKVHIFCYSRRSGTRAYGLSGQVPKEEKERRSHIMSRVCGQSRISHLRAQSGKIVPVLFESARDGIIEGFAPDYTPVWVKAGNELHGKIVEVKITGCDQNGCFGKVLENQGVPIPPFDNLEEC